VKTRFGEFVVDSETRQLLRDGEEIHLSPKAFDLLGALLAERPNVVAKTDLLGRIWPETFVVDANLNVLVGEIRRAIADDPQQPRFIRTVHKIGYAFCGKATDSGSEPSDERARSNRFWLVWKDRTLALSEGDNVIGRDPQCNVWLDESGVSRQHARIRIDGAARSAALEDLESTNGTFLGRDRVKGQRALTDGDLIKIGSVQLKFREWSADKPRPTERIRRRTR
jgi:DNA-binding winged helix-turn-helix (wHTH) protein